MKKLIGSLVTAASLAISPIAVLASTAGPAPGDPGYDPNIPSWMATRTIWLRHPDGHQVRIDLTEAYESHHWDYLVLHGPEGIEYLKTKCISGSWQRRGVYTHTSTYLDRLTNTLCGKQIRR